MKWHVHAILWRGTQVRATHSSTRFIPCMPTRRRAVLEELRKKGFDGTLTKKELNAFRRKGRGDKTARY